jgi:ribonuclease P protein component
VEVKEGSYETYLATKAHSAQTRTRFFKAYVNSQWETRIESSPRQGALEFNCLIVQTVALNRALRLRKNSDFQRVRQQGRSIVSRLLILAWAPNDGAKARVGFVVSKRIAKDAVTRNYIKRLLGEAVRPVLTALPDGWDIVISARNQVVGANLVMLTQEITTLLRRAQLLESAPITDTSG